MVSSSGNFKYPYVQVLDLSSAYISAPTNFNGNVNLSYKLISQLVMVGFQMYRRSLTRQLISCQYQKVEVMPVP